MESSNQRYNALEFLKKHTFLNRVVLFALLILLGLAAFKNISYPLLWNDEAETAMTAQQILKYGYPKVHDGKNTVFVPDNPMWLGYKARYDVLITIPWGNFYWGAIGVKLTEFTSDIYKKTALVRLPFVLAALAGLIVFAFSMHGFFASAGAFRVFFSAFLFFEMLSVNLLLHIREARYYSLVILITACFFYVFSAFHFHQKYTRRKYLLLLTVTLVAAFNVSYITYATLFATVGLYQLSAFLNYRWGRFSPVKACDLRGCFVLISPLVVSAVIISPALVFFQFFENARLANIYYHNTIFIYTQHLQDIFHVLCTYDLLPAVIMVKALRVCYAHLLKKSNLQPSSRTNGLEDLSFFMLLFLVMQATLTARMPFIYSRYFIVLQPVVILILLTDVLIILDYEAMLPVKKLWNSFRVSFLPIACIICVGDIALSDNHIADYVYQLTHQLKGPLDYYIPALQEKYGHPENIVVATNYEEFAYEYYLQCKVIIGYHNLFRTSIDENELKQDQPDVIIIRSSWKQDMYPYQYFLKHATYQKISFPVRDWPVNDLSDLYFSPTHQFKTLIADKESDRAVMFLKE